MENTVKHDKENHKFYLELEGKEAHLFYRIVDDKTLEFFHTFVPYEQRGGGVAAMVVEGGFKFAKEKGYKVIPSCSYVEFYIRRHKELEDLRA